jgi:simple sugar transport system substrate-binding protein/ribose transport system substrate-binding protein
MLAGCAVPAATTAPAAPAAEGAPADESAAPAEVLLGAVQMVADLEWFRTVELGMEAAADQYGAELLVANAQAQVDVEASMAENFAARGVNAILISALDSTASVPALQAAVEQGITLVNYNTTLDSPIMTSFVGVDNTELGAQAGRYVRDYIEANMGGEATIGLITIPAYEVGRQRREGFVAEVSQNPNIKIVAEQEGESPEAATSVVETVLQANPELDLIWAANEGGTIGALTATQGTDVKVVGTDMSLQVAKALLDETNGLIAISTQDPYTIGFSAAELAIKKVRGEDLSGYESGEAGGQQVDIKVLVPLALYEKAQPDAVNAYLEKYQSLAE